MALFPTLVLALPATHSPAHSDDLSGPAGIALLQLCRHQTQFKGRLKLLVPVDITCTAVMRCLGACVQLASKHFQHKVLQRLAEGSYEATDLGALIDMVPCDFNPKLFKRLRDQGSGSAGHGGWVRVY